METNILIALIGIAGTIIAALIAVLLPHWLNQKKVGKFETSQSRMENREEIVSDRPSLEKQQEVEGIEESNAGLITLHGTSASDRAVPRDLDLRLDGMEVQFHIHDPGKSRPKMWVGKEGLQWAMDEWERAGKNSPRIEVSSRTARKDALVAFVTNECDEIEVQAGWWIWVKKVQLCQALTELGVRPPW